MSVEYFNLLLDSLDCVVELFGVVSEAEDVVSNFLGVRPVASNGDQRPHINLCLSKLRCSQKGLVAGRACEVGCDSVALKNDGSIFKFKEREFAVSFFSLEFSTFLLFLADNNYIDVGADEGSCDSGSVEEEMVESVSVKFCHVCLIFVSIMN